MTDDLAVRAGVLSSQMEGVISDLSDFRADLKGFRAEMSQARSESVSRGEWLQRNAAVDARFESQGREIAQLRTDVHSRRAPWWNVLAVALSGVAIGWTIFGPVLTPR